MTMRDLNLIHIATHADEIFREIRWPEGPTCPVCGGHHYYTCANGRYKCKDCGKIYTIKTDSLFHGSHIPISYWLIALYLMLDGKGISSYELARKLQVTQKTAYYMLMRLRVSMSQDDTILDGEVAMDEIYVGGTWKNFCLSKRQALLEKFKLPKHAKTPTEKMAVANAVNARYKTPVYGMNDGQKIVLQAMPNPIRPDDVIDCFNKHTKSEGLAVSDCSRLYDNWKLHTGYDLHCNNHSKGQYVADNGSSSNRIEGEFGWLHRTNVFVQVHQRRCYVQLYLNEFAFRFNHRGMTITDKLTAAIKGCTHKVNRDTLRRLNDEEYKLLRYEDWFDPVKFFNECGALVTEVKRDGMVYRREEFVRT